MTGAPRPRGPLGLTLGAGLGLLALAAVLLVVGDVALFGDPAIASLWTLLIGLFLLVGSMAAALLRAPLAVAAPLAPAPEEATTSETELVQSLESLLAASAAAETPAEPTAEVPLALAPAPEPASVARPAPIARVGVAAEARTAVERAASVLPPGASAPPRTASSSPTSIPGAYLQSLTSASEREASLWSEVAPPIAAALPFSPGMQRRPDATPWSEEGAVEEEEPRLELELARLRARVRELETPAPSPRGLAAVSVARGPEPPAPPSKGPVAPLSCIACGSGVDPASPRLLCWGCGRTLCGGCYWRFGPGPAVHRCPDCAAGRSGTGPVTISGGRAGPAAASPTPPAAPPR